MKSGNQLFNSIFWQQNLNLVPGGRGKENYIILQGFWGSLKVGMGGYNQVKKREWGQGASLQKNFEATPLRSKEMALLEAIFMFILY